MWIEGSKCGGFLAKLIGIFHCATISKSIHYLICVTILLTVFNQYHFLPFVGWKPESNEFSLKCNKRFIGFNPSKNHCSGVLQNPQMWWCYLSWLVSLEELAKTTPEFPSCHKYGYNNTHKVIYPYECYNNYSNFHSPGLNIKNDTQGCMMDSLETKVCLSKYLTFIVNDTK
jgi:hypothetical protein